MDLFKFKSSKGSPGDRASGQSGSPDSSRRRFRESLGWGSRSRSRSRPSSPTVEKHNDTPGGSPASQSQADSASVHAQPEGPYLDTILQCMNLTLLPFSVDCWRKCNCSALGFTLCVSWHTHHSSITATTRACRLWRSYTCSNLHIPYSILH